MKINIKSDFTINKKKQQSRRVSLLKQEKLIARHKVFQETLTVLKSLPQSQSVISVHLCGGVSDQERTVSCVSQLLVHLLSANTENTQGIRKYSDPLLQ